MGKVKVCGLCGKLKGKVSFEVAHCTCEIISINVDMKKGYFYTKFKLSEPIKRVVLKDIKL